MVHTLAGAAGVWFIRTPLNMVPWAHLSPQLKGYRDRSNRLCRAQKRAHLRHLANATELSVCVGDAALCQITLNTYYLFNND